VAQSELNSEPITRLPADLYGGCIWRAQSEAAEATAPLDGRHTTRGAHGRRLAGGIYEAACKLDLEGIISKRSYKSGPCKSWIKVRNPKSPAYLRIVAGTF
jgi:bifunctional non-homologous end joining protein LigD